jgi:hypothetical protein
VVRTVQPLMDWSRPSRLLTNTTWVSAIFAVIVISLSAQAQTGRIYTSDDYRRAANLLNASTI